MHKEEQIFSKRPFHGGSVMILGSILCKEMVELVVMEDQKVQLLYIQILKKSLIPFLTPITTTNIIFQQDNAAILAAKVTKNWFVNQNIILLGWPIKSPEQNPIENPLQEFLCSMESIWDERNLDFLY